MAIVGFRVSRSSNQASIDAAKSATDKTLDVARDTNKATIDAARADVRRTLDATREGQIADLYTKAVEQLGSDKLDVRIGGIYALERVARDSARDHPTVMEVLTALIRQHSHEQWPPRGPGGREQDRWTRPDVQAALTVVGRRASQRDDRPIDLYTADLTRADLRRANLGGASLHGATLTGADLRGATLTGADLRNAITLRDARLDGADLNGAQWSENVPAPEGWKLDTGPGRLERRGTHPGLKNNPRVPGCPTSSHRPRTSVFSAVTVPVL